MLLSYEAWKVNSYFHFRSNVYQIISFTRTWFIELKYAVRLYLSEPAQVTKLANMQTYLDIDNDSNVEAYQIESDRIMVKFKSGTNQHYEYTYSSAGSSNVEHMKVLAECGDGLNSFISTNKPPYSSKW